MTEAKRGRGRPPKDPAPTNQEPELEDTAQRNIYSTFKLIGRVIGSSEKLTEEEFEDVGRGIADLTHLFPKAKAEIKQAVEVLGPAATVLDLAEKFSRIFSKSKLKDQVDEKAAALRQRLEGDKSAS